MTTEEKLQQVQLLSDGQITDADAKAGVGGVFSPDRPGEDRPLPAHRGREVAAAASRSCSPTTRSTATARSSRCRSAPPAPSTPTSPAADATIGARESATVGIKQIYSPMVDVSHEPRWGRIVEGNGEDPYLGSVMAAARVQGRPGRRLPASPTRTLTSGQALRRRTAQPEGGRDYNTTDMSESRLRNLYLPPFKAAIDAGADTVMCSFNSINGVPGCANKYTETDILKKEWGFDGFIESDYTAVAETRACPPGDPAEGPCGHGTAADGPEAGANALMAGTDSEMVSTHIRDYGEQLLAQTADHHEAARRRRTPDPAGQVPRRACSTHPYVDQAKAVDPAASSPPADRAAARTAAGRSMVLLKNDDQRHRPSRSTRRRRPR